MKGNLNRRKTDNITNHELNLNDENVEMKDYFDEDNIFTNNIIRRNSDTSGININTLINVKSERPIGLDLNSFMNHIAPDQTIHSISQSNDLPIIGEVIFELNLIKGK